MLGWELPPHNSGGLGVACFYMARALAQEGVEIDFILPSSEDYSSIDFMNIHNVKTGKTLKKSQKTAYSNNTAEIQVQQNEIAKKMKELASQNDYDAIHCHDWLTMEAGIEAKKILQKPLIAHIHATEFDRAGGGRGNTLIHEIEEQGLLMADKIIAVSKFTKDLIVKEYKIPSDKIEVIHNSLDLASISDISLDDLNYKYLELMQSRGYKIVTTIGRLTVQKGLNFFIEAAEKALKIDPKLLFVLGGDGEQRDELIELAAAKNISENVIFTGFIRGSQWRELYNVADIFVMSSVSEPFGLTALEAAAHNNAIILTKQTGVSERLKSVMLYDFWDTDKLADEITNIAKSPALHDELAENAGIEFDKFSWKNAAEEIIGHYHKLGVKNA